MEKNRTNDMTVGSPVKLIIQFMIPMFLGNIFSSFITLWILLLRDSLLVWMHLLQLEVQDR